MRAGDLPIPRTRARAEQTLIARDTRGRRPDPTIDLTDRVALVTGAGRGIAGLAASPSSDLAGFVTGATIAADGGYSPT